MKAQALIAELADELGVDVNSLSEETTKEMEC